LGPRVPEVIVGPRLLPDVGARPLNFTARRHRCQLEALTLDSKLKLSDIPLMRHDANRSPVSWYVGSYLLRFVEIRAAGNNDPRRRFLSWENTVLVMARSLEHAYAKVAKSGRAKTKPYRGGLKGFPVRWIYEGVTDLLPVYETLQDGAEIMWTERSPRTVKSLRRLVKSKRTLLARAGAA
jgi:hypothetical protein